MLQHPKHPPLSTLAPAVPCGRVAIQLYDKRFGVSCSRLQRNQQNNLICFNTNILNMLLPFCTEMQSAQFDASSKMLGEQIPPSSPYLPIKIMMYVVIAH